MPGEPLQADQALLLDDELWEQVVRASDGMASLCYQCGVCTATCPWGLVLKEPLNVRRLIRRAQLGLEVGGDALWLCTTCGLCELSCPRQVAISQVMLSLRRVAWRRRQVPRGLSRVLWDIQFDGNPWGSPPSHRSAWARGLDVPQFSATDHQVLYYVGCTVAYDRRAQRVARALVSLFRAAAVPFGILGDDEPCCGHAARDLGQLEYARHLAQQGAEIFRRAGVRTLVATSPHCYDMFSRHYPPVSDSFRPLHYTSFLAQLVEEGRLCFRPLPWRVTFHDPCYLGRRHGVVGEPRRILRAIPQLELKEMAHTGPKTLCCGGGGGRMWLETEAHARLSHLRVEEAAATGAQVLVTACPHCIACLEDSVKLRGLPLRVMDVAEVAAAALAGGEMP